MDYLAAADGALGDPPDRLTALEHLVRAWREHHRHPDLANLVERLSHASTRAREPLDPTLADADYHASWIARASRADRVDVELLLPGLFRGPLGKRISERFALLLPFADDPRVTLAFGRMIDEPPVMSVANFSLWTRLFAALHRAPDIRLRPVLERCVSSPFSGSRFWPMLQQRSLALLRELPQQPPALSPAVREQIAAVRQRITKLAPTASITPRSRPSIADQLLAKIYREPELLEHRMVWADALQNLGDPRGEFVQLQLARDDASKPGKRERALLAQYELAWLAELAPVVDRRRLRWANGFPIEAEVVFNSQTERALIGSEVWATFQAIDCNDFELIRSPTMRSLRRVGGFGTELLRALVEHHGPAFALEQLGPISLAHNPPPELDALCSPALPLIDVRELWLHQADTGLSKQPHAFDWLFTTPLGRRLTRFRLSAAAQLDQGIQPTSWREWIAARKRWSGLESLRLDIGFLSIELCDGGRLRVRTSLTGELGPFYDEVVRDQLADFRAEFPRLQLISCGFAPLSPDTAARWAMAADFPEFEHIHSASRVPISSQQASRALAKLQARQRKAKNRITRAARQAQTESAPRPPRRYGPGPTGPWVALDRAKLRARLSANSNLAFAPDGQQLYVINSQLAALSVPDLKLVWSLRDQNRSALSSLAIEPRERQLWIGTNDGATILWDLRADEELARARFHTGQVNAVAIDRQRMVSADRDRKLHLWAYPPPPPVESPIMLIPEQTIGLDAGPSALALDPAGTRLALLANNRVHLRPLDQLERRQDIAQANPQSKVLANVLAWSPDGIHLLAGHQDGSITVLDPDGIELTTVRVHDRALHALTWTPDAARLITIGDDDQGPTIRVIDSESGELTLRIQPSRSGQLQSLAASPDGRVLAVSAPDWIACWSLEDGAELGVWEDR